MRIVLFVFCAFVFCSNLLGAALPRVGDSIDVAERNYFELFPLLQEFEYALVMENGRGDSNFVLAYYEVPQKQQAYYLEARAYSKLAEYLNNFEAIAVGQVKANLSGIGGIVSEFREKHSRGAMLNVRRRDGLTLSGRLFCIDSTGIVLSYQNTPPNWQNAATFVVIPVDEIAQIKKPGISAAKGTAVGALGGAAFGAGLGAVVEDEGAWGGQGPQVAFFISFYGVLGGAAGFIYSRYHTPKKFSMNGSDEQFARAKAWLAPMASSRHIPPELRPLIADNK